MTPVIRTNIKDRNTFDSLNFQGYNQQEKFANLLAEYIELKAKVEAMESGGGDVSLASIKRKKDQTAREFLSNIPNSILFLKDGEYQGKKLKGYPGVASKRIQRLVDTLMEINEHLKANNKKAVRISASSVATLLNANWQSVKKAWSELDFESIECSGKSYSFYELIQIESEIFPDSSEMIFNIIANQ
jgi:hypothetical protein